MTATDELRRMLDERGVEWKAFDDFEQTTQWSTHNGAFVYWARERDGKLFVETTAPTKCSASCTPEQAIAATLGRGMLTADDVRDLIERHSDASGGNGRDFHNGAYVAIADELNATLGSCNCSNSERTDVPRLPHFWTHDGTLHVELPKLPESISVRLSDVRDREVSSARVWQYTLSDADATPTRQGDGTCHDTGTFKSWGLFTCSNCSIVIPLNAVKDAPEIGKVVPLNYCPNCGARCVG